ncbi:albumin-binding GA domain-containing protein [Enterococcus hulanensis]|uniref:albumin-binding GA domain-containing protein n=1 Tax=Enterococcus hulanensis TaxID=2559929 RepID=UPI0010FA5267|nr:albumin-binding GA domain-containing protein [Enterococcus hulanensis]
MKRSFLNSILASEKKYRAKMVKGKHGWLVKGMVFGTLLFGGMLIDSVSVEAAWAPNTVEQIASRIKDGQKSITMIEGDTVYNIGLAINIKDPMQLLYDNGFKDGEQYTLPVGTKISWDGNHVTVTDPQGNVIGDSVVKDEQKHNPDQPVAGQASDTPQVPVTGEKQSANAASNNQNVATEKPSQTIPQAPITENGQGSPNQETPAKPSNPGTTPEKPTNPGQPTNPEKPKPPVVPEQPEDNRTELEKLKAQLADLEAKLQVAEQELATAKQNLEDAKNQPTAESIDQQISDLQAAITQKEASKATLQSEITNLENQQSTANTELVNAQANLNNILATQQQAQDAVTAAQAALEAIKETGDPTQIANAEAALETAQNAASDVAAQVAQAQSAVDEKQNAVTSIENQVTSKQNELNAAGDTSTEQAKIAELQAQKEGLASQSIAELEQIVVEKQKVVDDLKAQIEEVKQKIAAIELKVDRSDAINSLKQFTYLTQELVDGYVARINSALSKGEIQAVVSEASAKNAELQAKYEEEQAAKELVKAKESAIQVISGLTLTNDEKADFTSQVNAATSIDQVNSVLETAKAKSIENETAKQLEKTKTDAKTSIDSMNITNDEKSDFKSKVEAATTVDEVKSIVSEAQKISDENDAKEEEAKKLAEAKSAAITQLEQMNLKDQLNSFKSKVNAATTVDEVKSIVNEAQVISDQNDADEQDAKELQEAKESAFAKLDTLNLKDQKQSFVDQVNDAQSTSVIDRILEEAQKVSDENDAKDQDAKELAQAKTDALTKLDSMNLKDQKQNFVDQVNAATTVDQVTNVVSEAQKVSDSNDKDDQNAEKLQKAKDAAIKIVNGLNLTNDEKTSFINQINAATTTSQIDQIVQAAKDKVTENEEAAKLEKAKQEALAKLDAMNLKDQLASFKSKVNAATTIDQVNKAVEDAQKVSDENDQKDEDAKQLAEAKEVAIKEINALEHLSSSEKQGFVSQVNAATTVDQVTTALNTAKAKNEENAPELELTLQETKDKWSDQIRAEGLGIAAAPYLVKINKATTIEEVLEAVREFMGASGKVYDEIPTIQNSKEEQQNYTNTFLDELNAYRKESGLKGLSTNDKLQEAADLRAKELAESFSHTRPNGSGVITAIDEIFGGASKNPYTLNGECIASVGNVYSHSSGGTLAEKVLDMWQNSEGHDAILKHNKGTDIGVSFFVAEDGTVYMVFLIAYK